MFAKLSKRIFWFAKELTFRKSELIVDNLHDKANKMRLHQNLNFFSFFLRKNIFAFRIPREFTLDMPWFG